MRLRVFNVAIAGLLSLASGCAARLDPTWVISDATPVRAASSPSEDDQPGIIEYANGALPVVASGEIPRPSAAEKCGFGSPDPVGIVAAMRPGVGTRLTVRYWSTFDDSTTFQSALLPSSSVFDVVLRLAPVDGKLSPEESTLLAAFLATNRNNPDISKADKAAPSIEAPEDKQRSQGLRVEAASVVARNETRLWNALVRTLCVQFVAVSAEGTVDGVDVPGGMIIKADSDRHVFSFAADMLALCRAIDDDGRDSDKRVFAELFLPAALSGACSTTTDGIGNTRPLLGFGAGDQGNSAASVAAGSASVVSETNYFTYGPRVATVSTITLQSPRFHSRGTETWSLADWESSGLCDVPGKPRAAIAAIRMKGGARFRIVTGAAGDATNRVQRRLATGYRHDIVGPDWRTSKRTLSHAALFALGPSDVDDVVWVDRKMRRHHECSRSL